MTVWGDSDAYHTGVVIRHDDGSISRYETHLSVDTRRTDLIDVTTHGGEPAWLRLDRYPRCTYCRLRAAPDSTGRCQGCGAPC